MSTSAIDLDSSPRSSTGSPDEDRVLLASLRQLAVQQGLYKPQLRYYAGQLAAIVLTLVACGCVLVTCSLFVVRLLDGVLLSIVLTRVAFIGHDAGHRQIFRSARANDLLLLLITPLLGIAPSWWAVAHGEHHENPNNTDRDPNICIRVAAFSPAQARAKRGLARFLCRYQAYYLPFVVMLEILNMNVASLASVLTKRSRYRVFEAIGMISYVALFVGFAVSTMPLREALLFLLTVLCLRSLYIGAVFAPNHWGMPTYDDRTKPTYLSRQLLTTRNVRPGRFTDFMLGGLNYQIEHHLFPGLPRNRLCRAQALVRPFCSANGLVYEESSFWRAYQDIFRVLNSDVWSDNPGTEAPAGA